MLYVLVASQYEESSRYSASIKCKFCKFTLCILPSLNARPVAPFADPSACHCVQCILNHGKSKHSIWIKADEWDQYACTLFAIFWNRIVFTQGRCHSQRVKIPTSNCTNRTFDYRWNMESRYHMQTKKKEHTKTTQTAKIRCNFTLAWNGRLFTSFSTILN